MTADLNEQLLELEAEFATLQGPLVTLRRQWEGLREQVRPLEQRMADLEAGIDAIRHGERYRALAAQLPHLRKAVAG